MIEYKEEEQVEEQPETLGVRVIGVGGAGANVLDRMALEGSDEAELLTLNTDMRALSTSVSSEKIQLGSTLLKGMGTGGDPELGKQAALEAVDEIRAAVRGSRIVFVCVGLGGGTGSGAGPEVCRIVKEEGIFLVVFATLPFSFEGERRMNQAIDALDAIGKYADAVVTFENDRMGELIVPRDGVAQAFAAADKIISQSIRATVNVAYRPGIIRIGMDDLLSALRSENSRCLFGYGQAKGENRSLEAVDKALKCPLLDRGKLLNDARTVLVQVAGGETMTLYEVQLVMDEVSKHVGKHTQILFGTGTDERLGNSLAVTILSSVSGPRGAAAHPTDDDDEEEARPQLGSPMAVDEEEDMPVSPLASAMSAASEPEALRAPAPPAGYAPVEDEPEEEEADEPSHAIYEPIDPEPTPAKASPPPMPKGDLEEDTDRIPTREAVAVEPKPSKVVDAPFPKSAPVEDSDYEEEEVTNPIAKAMAETGPKSPPPIEPETLSPPPMKAEPKKLTPFDPDSDEAAAAGKELDRVEAQTETAQTITLSRIVSSGNTGRIKTRDPNLPPAKGPVDPHSPPQMPGGGPEKEAAPAAVSKEAREQQEMLQLEPANAGKGRFAKTDPTIVDGEDLDIPTFLRKK